MWTHFSPLCFNLSGRGESLKHNAFPVFPKGCCGCQDCMASAALLQKDRTAVTSTFSWADSGGCLTWKLSGML